MFWSWLSRNRTEKPEQAIVQEASVPLRGLTFSPLPLETTRNDIYTQGYTYPPAQADRDKYYNNAFWGNAVPPSGHVIGIPGYTVVHQKLWATQYSPEQSPKHTYKLTGGAYPYAMSQQQAADLVAQMAASWQASAGHGV